MGHPPCVGNVARSGIQSAIVGWIKFQEFAVPPVKFSAYVRVCGVSLGHFAQRGPQLHDTLCGSLRIDESVGCCRGRLIHEELVAILTHMKRQQIGLGDGAQVRSAFLGAGRGKRLDLSSGGQIRSALVVILDLLCPGGLMAGKTDRAD